MLVSGEFCSDPLGTLQKVFPSCTDNEAHGTFTDEVFLVFSSKNESKHKLVSIQLEKDPLTTSMMIRDGIKRDSRGLLGEMTVALCYAASEQATAEQDPTKMQIDDIIMVVSTNIEKNNYGKIVLGWTNLKAIQGACCACSALWLVLVVLTVSGSHCVWFSLCLILTVSGSCWVWFSLCLVLTVSDSHCVWFLLGLVLTVSGSRCV